VKQKYNKNIETKMNGYNKTQWLYVTENWYIREYFDWKFYRYYISEIV